MFARKLLRYSCLLAVLSVASSFATAQEKPNVLFIAVDDLNDWIGCLNGHPQAFTPNMDRLASRGMLFSNAHCAAPACNPSRAAVFSGRMPNVTKVWSNESAALSKLYPQAKTLPAAFRDAGYSTAGTGKLFHKKARSDFDTYFATEQRWSPFDGDDVKFKKSELPSKGSNNPQHKLTDSQGGEVILPINRMPSDRRPNTTSGESFDWGGFDLPDQDWGDTKITDWATEQIDASEDRPSFLAVGYYRPHIPLFAPGRFFQRFEDERASIPPYRKDDLADLSATGQKWAREAITAGLHSSVVEHDQWQTAVEAYLACVTYVDYEIGRLVAALEDSAAANDTWIVLWSDHGWQLGEKDHWGKWTGWERSTKVPLIIVPPKSEAASFAKAGTICDTPVSLIDLYPTLLETCRITGPEVLDGQSLVPLLKNPSAAFRTCTLTMFDEGNASLRDKKWRYIRYKDGSEEIYDLEADPNEWTNLIQDSHTKDALFEMRDALQNELARFE